MSKKITVFGTRGIPDVLGGVETHCQNLYPAIKQQFDVDICVIARSPYVSYKRSSYKKVETYALWAPKKRSLEAIVHSVLAAFTVIQYVLNLQLILQFHDQLLRRLLANSRCC